MIITKILGGLGNQLFQYAAGRALALATGTELKLDLSGFKAYRLRSFELDALCVACAAASPNEIERLKAQNTLQRVWQRLLPVGQRKFYKEPHFHFDPQFRRLRPPVYLQGYFQSQDYFFPVADTIRSEFRFRHRFSPALQAMAARLKNEDSVCLHIRRGDYQNPETVSVHGILPAVYYREAIRLLQERLAMPLTFYLFCDDPQSVGDVLADLPIIQVSGVLTTTALEDFYLMQHCRHQVIANSSFGWWAAWLNDFAGKMVVAPKNWFNKGPADTDDLIPPGWFRL